MEYKREDEEAEQRFQESLRLRDSDDLPVAEKLLLSLASEDPENLSVLIVLAGVLYELEKFTEAAEVFRAIIERQPAHALPSLGLFRALWKSGREGEAIQEIQRFLLVADSPEHEGIMRDIVNSLNKG